MEKKTYEAIKDIRLRIQRGEKTTFSERNYLNRMTKKKRQWQTT